MLWFLSHLIVVKGKEVILLGHSSGGFVATLVARPELQAEVRRKQGSWGGIVGIFHASGFLISVGESVHSFYQPKDGSEPVVPLYMVVHVRSPDPDFLGIKVDIDFFSNDTYQLEIWIQERWLHTRRC